MKKILWLLSIIIFIILAPFYVNADQLELDNEWQTDLYVADIEKDSDNNYYLVGEWGDALFEKYDNNRNLIFSKPLSQYELIQSVSVDDEKNAYLACYGYNDYFIDPNNNINREISGNKITHSHIIKYDINGNQLFDVDLDSGNNYSLLKGIKVYNNYIYIIGHRYLLDNHVRTEGTMECYNYIGLACLIKMDFSGNVVKEIVLGDRTDLFERLYYNDSATSGAMIHGSSIIKDSTILYKDDKIYVYKSIDHEIFFGGYSTDLTNIQFNEFGNNSNINDIVEDNNGNYVTVGRIDVKDMDPSQTSKCCPGIIKYSPEGDILSYKIIEGKGLFSAIKYKDNGYYGLLYLDEENINEYNNDSRGYYLVRYDQNFNVQDTIFLSNYCINLFDFDNTGISVLDGYGLLQHYYTKFDYNVSVINDEEKGKLTLEEDREYYPDEVVTFNIETNEGYKLKEVQVIDEDGNQIEVTDNNSFIMPSSSVTIKPIFKKLNNRIILILKDETEDAVFNIEDLTSVPNSEIVKFRITAVEGYAIENITITDEDNNDIKYDTTDNENEYVFTMPDSDIKIEPFYVLTTNNENEDSGEETNTEKENKDENQIVEKINTILDKLVNPTTGDKLSEFAILGGLGLVIFIIVIIKKRKHSTRKSNIQF